MVPNVKVGVNQGSVLNPLLFIIVMEAISWEFRTSCPWELLYADDLVVIAESVPDFIAKFEEWESNLERKGLRVNNKKTKIMCCSRDVACASIPPSNFPCGVCSTGVGSNSILCIQCLKWIHKRCTGIKGKLKNNPEYICPKWHGLV